MKKSNYRYNTNLIFPNYYPVADSIVQNTKHSKKSQFKQESNRKINSQRTHKESYDYEKFSPLTPDEIEFSQSSSRSLQPLRNLQQVISSERNINDQISEHSDTSEGSPQINQKKKNSQKDVIFQFQQKTPQFYRNNNYEIQRNCSIIIPKQNTQETPKKPNKKKGINFQDTTEYIKEVLFSKESNPRSDNQQKKQIQDKRVIKLWDNKSDQDTEYNTIDIDELSNDNSMNVQGNQYRINNVLVDSHLNHSLNKLTEVEADMFSEHITQKYQEGKIQSNLPVFDHNCSR